VTGACRCELATIGYDLGFEEEAVDDCDAPPSGVEWSCCHDLDSLGETTRCDCSVSLCVEDTVNGECTCGYLYHLQTGPGRDEDLEVDVESCTAPDCCASDTECYCTIDNYTVCWLPDPVDVCTPPTEARDCNEYGRSASSCAGLTWQQP
jgi:hypothetical protein